jgi:hypothetical protein
MEKMNIPNLDCMTIEDIRTAGAVFNTLVSAPTGVREMVNHPNRKPTAAARFGKAVEAMFDHASRVNAYAILQPHTDPRQIMAGKVLVKRPKDGAGRLHVVAWLPYGPEPGGMPIDETRHANSAVGFGYDKAGAAMEGACFWSLRDERPVRITTAEWETTLREHGYQVEQLI